MLREKKIKTGKHDLIVWIEIYLCLSKNFKFYHKYQATNTKSTSNRAEKDTQMNKRDEFSSRDMLHIIVF